MLAERGAAIAAAAAERGEGRRALAALPARPPRAPYPRRCSAAPMAVSAGHRARCAQQAGKVVGGGAGRCGGGARGGRGRPRRGRCGGETAPRRGSAAINPVTAAMPARPRARRGPTGGSGAARTRSRSPAAVSGLGASAGGSELDEAARPGPLGTSPVSAAPGRAADQPQSPGGAGRGGDGGGGAAAAVAVAVPLPSWAADGAGACGPPAPDRLGCFPAVPPADSWRSWADLVRKMLLFALACRRSAAPHPRLRPSRPPHLLVRLLLEDRPPASTSHCPASCHSPRLPKLKPSRGHPRPGHALG